jgi:sugar/nucleoside kinase (ribokinase family)
VRLTTLGDLLLDVIVLLDDPLEQGADRLSQTRVCAGGQAANVAAWAATLGATARFVGKRGADAAGEIATRELSARGVEVAGPVEGRTGVVVSISEDGDRAMASDRGTATELDGSELAAEWFDCDVLHVSGYTLLAEPAASAALRAAAMARQAGATVSLDLSAWTLIDSAFRARANALQPHLVFATEAEYQAFGEFPTRWVVKRGADGVVVDGQEFAVAPAELVDATGAGDAFAAGFLVGGVELGLQTAARCVGQLGAMP